MPIAQDVKDLIKNAWADGHVCLLATIGKDGPNMSPKGSLFVFDDQHLAYWERSRKQALENVQQDNRVSVIYANQKASKFLRFYGTAQLVEDGPLKDKIFSQLSERERTHDGADKGIGVLVKISRAVDMRGQSLLG